MDTTSHGARDKGHYRFDLDYQVETCVQEYEEDMKAWYAEGGPTDPQLSTAIFDQAKRFAEHVFRTTEDLAPPKPTDCALVEPELRQFIARHENRLAELAGILERRGLDPTAFLTAFREMASGMRPEDGTILKIVWELLLIASMWDSVEHTRNAATRLLLLSTLRVPVNPTDRARAFLKQAAQCFTWGFYIPCIVFCRSAIDVALADAGFRKGSLKARIEKTPAHMLDAEHKRYAHEVRNLANDALHDKPLAMQDVMDVIRKTLMVLQQIAQARCT